jgi:alkylhydroperoxidase/carboxymuconolactone decarboxylase family protein YurZ
MWSKPDALDRLAQLLVALAALIALGNGLIMLIDPFGWYDMVGTVKATGPANAHFIRDIGLAYLLSAGLLGYAALNLPMRWGSALAGSSWLALHGGLHIWEVTAGLCAPGIFWSEAPGTLGPPLIALAGVGLQMARQRVSPGPLPSRVFIALADKMTYGLAPNLKDFAAAPGHLAEKFAQFMPFTLHRHAASAEQIAMARLAAVMAEDCGPCVEIAARGALMTGVPREMVNQALAGSLASGAAVQAFAFGRAIAQSLPGTDELGEAIEAEFGRAVRTELTIAAATGRVHPAFKRGLGYAKSCAAHPLQL